MGMKHNYSCGSLAKMLDFCIRENARAVIHRATSPLRKLAKMEACPQEPRRGQPAARPLSPSPAVPSSSSAEARYATPGAKAKVPSLDVPTSSTGPYSHRAPTGTWRSSAAASSARASARSASARLAEPAKPSSRRSAPWRSVMGLYTPPSIWWTWTHSAPWIMSQMRLDLGRSSMQCLIVLGLVVQT